MSKCTKCRKNLTKTRPGVECNRCERQVHLDAECSGLTTKQRGALRANENLEWTCQECTEISPKRRSIVIPDEDDDEEIDQVSRVPVSGQVEPIDWKKLLRDINSLLEKAIKRELSTITQSLEFNSEKMDDMLEGMEALKATVQDLKKKNVELSNKCNNLQTRVGALKQRVQEMEQDKLCKTIDIYNLPLEKEVNANVVVNTIAEKLQVPSSDVVDIKCFPSNKDRAGKLQVILEKESMQSQWLVKAKNVKLTVADVVSTAPENKAKEPVYVSEALTPYNRILLRSARKQLRESGLYKFVWCKRGVIRARKSENEQSTVIRAEGDIKQLLS